MRTTVIGSLLVVFIILSSYSCAIGQTAYVSHLDWRLPLPSSSYSLAVTVGSAVNSTVTDLRILSGSYPEKVVFSKPMTISAVDGTVIIGKVFGENPHKNFEYLYKGQTHDHANICVYYCYNSQTYCYEPECNECWPRVEATWLWGAFYCEYGDNPKVTPLQLEYGYKNLGYDFIALTHHHTIIPDPGADGILHIDGVEDGDWDWPYNPPHILGINVQYDADDDDWTCQARIDYFNSQGGLSIIAHPYDSQVNLSARDEQCVGYFGHMLMGLYRYIGNEISPKYPTEDIRMWDEALAIGHLRWAIASDDSHSLDPGDTNKGWVKVQSEKPVPEKTDIVENIRWGNFFSGRRGKSKSLDPKDADSPDLTVVTDSKNKKVIVSVKATKGADFCEVRFMGSIGRVLRSQRYLTAGAVVEYEWDGTEGGYIRVEAEDNYGWITFSQPIKCMQLSSS